ncbi:MAG TPA: hypothetical protein PKA28_13775 [Methylomusa anaerophila]|uniref:Outer membrane protein n=1 Tax=Methylomusa anaerophila TaxID=1930071 RepID=A0A348AKF8_9FIRM|nr:hypothetical protein [Methylomusa anaerophila]BBB91556.1 Outer membrane protein [Methylomusa anaerophila]HML89506.1 hypothetical protein [Methylomusa anaerophila]
MLPSIPRWFRFLGLLGLSAALLTGCASKQSPGPNLPPQPAVGVIDMDKALQAHPKAEEWAILQKEAQTIVEQINTETRHLSMNNSADSPAAAIPPAVQDGQQAALTQEYNAKMAAKEKEVRARLDAKAAKIHADLDEKMKAYEAELEKEYQPQIFNIQLKLQTLHLEEKEANELKNSLEQLKKEQAEKLAARQQELSNTFNEALAPDKAAAEQEMAEYAKNLSDELNARARSFKQELNGSVQAPNNSLGQADAGGRIAELEHQLEMKKQEIQVLQEAIIKDVQDKTAKVAAEHRLETVLAGHKMNIAAVDVTDWVIAELKK